MAFLTMRFTAPIILVYKVDDTIASPFLVVAGRLAFILACALFCPFWDLGVIEFGAWTCRFCLFLEKNLF